MAMMRREAGNCPRLRRVMSRILSVCCISHGLWSDAGHRLPARNPFTPDSFDNWRLHMARAAIAGRASSLARPCQLPAYRRRYLPAGQCVLCAGATESSVGSTTLASCRGACMEARFRSRLLVRRKRGRSRKQAGPRMVSTRAAGGPRTDRRQTAVSSLISRTDRQIGRNRQCRSSDRS